MLYELCNVSKVFLLLVLLVEDAVLLMSQSDTSKTVAT